MMRYLRWFSTLGLLVVLTACGGDAPPPQRSASPLPADSDQLLTVVTADDAATTGTLRRYQREQGEWQPVGAPMAIVVGRTGLAWGRGLATENPVDGPVKREGDGKSPSGMFDLGPVFGFAPAAEMDWLRMPYLAVEAMTECVDDPGSDHYNRIVSRVSVDSVDWSSSEKMLAVGAQYALGVVVEHNWDDPVAGGGSCIFLHIWGGRTVPTVGCTAMSENDLRTVAGWLDSARRPVLVQLTAAGYAAARDAWGLPAIAP